MFCDCSVTRPGLQHTLDSAVLEEHRTLVAVDGELRIHRDVLVRVLVDDELLTIVGPRDHHLAHAVLHEIEDAHGSSVPSDIEST